MFTVIFWQLAGERAAKTFLQTLVAVLGVGGFGVLDAPWLTATSTAAMAGLLSVLSSLSSTRVGEPADPSAIRHTQPSASSAVGQA